jgi:hypothetical protein
MWAKVAGNAYYILGQQYIAADLNMLKNATAPAGVQAAFSHSTGLFQTYIPAQVGALKGSNAVRQDFITQAGILGDYNTGASGPGHCGG